ncbi:DUF167 domain-containing protein [Thermosulfurimonas sp.]|uniref:DUF167 domain-containing protein n=1 Tax=Thermosulfurimonas sp. TaxID=2080236 RepID=UPI00343006A1
MLAVQKHPEGTLLRVRVQPRARKNEIVGYHGEALKIRLTAPAQEGRANAALLEFLAQRLKIARRNLTLLSGEKSREKIILIRGLDPEEVMSLL